MAVLLLKQVVKNTAATVTQNSQDLAMLGETEEKWRSLGFTLLRRAMSHTTLMLLFSCSVMSDSL